MEQPERQEGYWRCQQSDASSLPWPKPDEEWSGRERFLRLLSIVEGKAVPIDFTGYSMCRLCGVQNGTVEFWLGSWAWPEGLRHYIADHDVRPSPDFEGFVRAEAGE